MVIAARCFARPLGHGSSAELGHSHRQRVAQKAPSRQVLNEAGHGLVVFLRASAMVDLEASVRVPVSAGAAVKDLYETDTPRQQSTRS